MFYHLEHYRALAIADLECTKNIRQFFALRELYVYNRSDDLYNFSALHDIKNYYCIDSAPAVISVSSLVIAACRDLLYSSVSRPPMSEALSEALFMATRRAECSERGIISSRFV